MKNLLLSSALLAAAPGLAQALTITLDCEILKDASGSAMPISGLVVLSAGTSGNFFGPTSTAFVSGDEIMLKTWDLSAFATPGVLSDFTGDLPPNGAWDAGDPLRIYWYPTLSLASTEPGAGTQYGTYRDAIGIDGSQAWITGSPSATTALKFYTADAAFLNAGGSNSADAGRANLTVIPEPGTGVVILTTLFAAAVIMRRRQRVTAG